MAEEIAFQELLQRVRAGEAEAAAELVRLYEPAIRRAARIRLTDPRLRRLFDSLDVCQSVFASFFVRVAAGQYELDRPERLLRLLVDMSRKKLADRAREESAARRDYRRAGSAASVGAVAAAGPGPAEQAAARELLHEVRRRLTEEERRLADLRAGGRDWAEIAEQEGGGAEALRKKLGRAIDRVVREVGLDGFDND